MLSAYEQPFFDKDPQGREWFQRELDRIGGMNPYGGPRLRVVWGAQAVKFRRGEMVLAYPQSNPTKELNGFVARFPDGKEEWIPPESGDKFPPGALLVLPSYKTVHKGIDLWVIEEWVGPAELAPGWSAGRWAWEDGKKVDKTGPLPERGCYRHVCTVSRGGQYVPLNEDALKAVRGTLAFNERENQIGDAWAEDSEEKRERRERREYEEAVAAQERNEREFEEELAYRLKQDSLRIHNQFREEYG